MLCSPTRLCMEVNLWSVPGFLDIFLSQFNKSQDQNYDCALLSVPCESNITKEFFSFDPDVVYWFDVIVVHFLTGLIIPVGIAGNIINIIIMAKYNIANDSTNSFLLGLAVSDLMSILCNAVINVCSYLCFIDTHIAVASFHYILFPFQITSRYLTLLCLDFVTAISVQRAAAVFLPFKVKTIFSKRNTYIIIAIFVLAFLYNIHPQATWASPQYVFHFYFNKVVPLGYKHKWPHTVAVNHFTYLTGVRGGLGVAAIFLFGSLTILKLKWQAKHRAALKATTDTPVAKMSVNEQKLTSMTLTVSFISFAVYTFSISTTILLNAFADELYRHSAWCMLTHFVSYIYAFNSTVNFFIYFGMSAKFREVCKTLFSLH